jgi:Ni,Fe-hydrogenase III large subunit/Ni,Fe-hydrogenase III component G
MTAQDLKERIRAGLDGRIRELIEPVPGQVYFTVDRGDIRRAADYVAQTFNARYLITAGIDKRDTRGDFEVDHIFALDPDKMFVTVRSPVPADDTRIDAITPTVPGAGWAEREMRDLVGIEAVGHPDPRRLVTPNDWPDGVYPLRNDVPYGYRPEPVPERPTEYRDPPEGASVLPIGPFFPVLEEPSYWRVFIDGETVVGCDYRGFYNHRGIEKIGGAAQTYNEIPFTAQRICGICGLIHSTCYCEAVERAAGIQVPLRAHFIRSIVLEFERIHSHLLWVGIAAHILGFDTVLMQTWRIREPIMWLCELLTGNRKAYDINLVGGVRRDIPRDTHPKILEVIGTIEKQLVEVVGTIPGDSTLLLRCKNVGVLSTEDTRKVAVVGPPARASNVDIDARRDHPYSAYDQIEFDVPVYDSCDVLARVLVRMDEVIEAIKMVRRLLERMPEGPIMAKIEDELPPWQEGICTVEAPRGEAIHYVWTGPDNRPARWRVRAPTYNNLQGVPFALQGVQIADVPITIGSFDPCFSCTERVEIVQAKTGETRVYSQDELLELSREKSKGMRR